MTLQSAIAALNPRNYWVLNETSGAYFADIGSSPQTMSILGDTAGIGAVGPELGSYALRVFNAMSAISGALSISAWGDFSIQAMVSIPSNGAPSTATPMFGFGDINNPATRGFRVMQQSSSAQSANTYLAFSGNSFVGGLAWPQSNWHLWTWSFTLSPNMVHPYIDGVALTPTAGASGTAPLSTDTMWIKSTAPVVIAHLAYWTRALSQTEVQTVSNQMQAWPYQTPINVPLTTGSTTVDLTPVTDDTATIIANQSTFMPQITTIVGTTNTIQTTTTTIQTDTHNLVNTLFPQLADELNAIMSAVTATLTGAAGAISKTLGDLFSGKLLDLITEFDLGTACAPDTINVGLGGGTFFGLQMNCTSYADWYAFTGDADDYTIQALGVLQIFRGGSSILRVGLHTTTHTVYPLPGIPAVGIETEEPTIPGDYTVILTPAPETCWHLVALQFP